LATILFNGWVFSCYLFRSISYCGGHYSSLEKNKEANYLEID